FNSSQGPQQREFRKEILQTMQVGVGRRNKFCENIISAIDFFRFWFRKLLINLGFNVFQSKITC
ncbi:hypothetical protein AAGW95_13540, partial [Staphylococcus aureus]